MPIRKMLMGACGAAGLAGWAHAAPPGVDEGREPNPVVREFHLPEPPALGYVAPETGREPGASSAGRVSWPGLETLVGLAIDQFTVPLGTVRMWD